MRLLTVLLVVSLATLSEAAPNCPTCNLKNRSAQRAVVRSAPVQSVPVQSVQSVQPVCTSGTCNLQSVQPVQTVQSVQQPVQTIQSVQPVCTSGTCNLQSVQSYATQQVAATPVVFVPAQVYYSGQTTTYDQSAVTASGLGYSYQPAGRQDVLKSIDSKLDLLIDALIKNNGGGGNSDDVDPNPVQPSSKGLPMIKGTKIVPPQSEKLGWKEILQNSCVKCHGMNSTSNFSMVDDNGQLLSKLPRMKIYQAITSPVKDDGHMPKNGPSLPKDQIETIRDWARNGLVDLDY